MDWSRTSAFAIPSFYTGFLRVNLTGREPQGIVAPGREYECLLDRLESDLRSLTHSDTGDAAVADVLRPGELFGERPPGELPDLIVHWGLSDRPRRIVHPRARLRPGYYGMPRANHHSRRGLVIAAGPSVGSQARRDLSPLDLAPLLLSLLGYREGAWSRDGH
jgi:predicted AlkP superfamily phosphohydrolase/phosphomutase